MRIHATRFGDNFPVLRTKRLLLRQLRREDADKLYAYSCDEAVTRYLDWRGPSSPEEAEQMIVSWNDMYKNNTLLPWGITLNRGGGLIGTIMCMPVRGTFDAKPLLPLTVGFDLAKSYWNKGLMTEALESVLAFDHERFGAHRIQAEVVPENKASIRLLEKLGFRQEGILHQYLLHDATKMFLDVVKIT